MELAMAWVVLMLISIPPPAASLCRPTLKPPKIINEAFLKISQVYVRWEATNADCANGWLIKWWWVDQENKRHEDQAKLGKPMTTWLITKLKAGIEYTLEVCIVIVSSDK